MRGQLKSSKKKNRAILELLLEYAMLPFLALCVAVLFDIDWNVVQSHSLGFESAAAHLCSVAIPLIGSSYILSRAILIHKPKSHEMPSLIEWTESIGMAFGYTGFICFLCSKSLTVGVSFLVASVIGFILIFFILKQQKKENNRKNEKGDEGIKS